MSNIHKYMHTHLVCMSRKVCMYLNEHIRLYVIHAYNVSVYAYKAVYATYGSPDDFKALEHLNVRQGLYVSEWIYTTTLISIMTVSFFLEKKNSSSNSGAKAHRFGLCSQRSVSILFFFCAKKRQSLWKSEYISYMHTISECIQSLCILSFSDVSCTVKG